MTVIEEEEKKRRAAKDSCSTEEKNVPSEKKHLSGLLFIQTNTQIPSVKSYHQEELCV